MCHYPKLEGNKEEDVKSQESKKKLKCKNKKLMSTQVTRISKYLQIMRGELPGWIAWKIYDTLFCVLVILSLRMVNKKTRSILSYYYAFLGWEPDGQDKIIPEE